MESIPLLGAVFSTFGEAMPGGSPPVREMQLTNSDKCCAEMRAHGF
jgi:hypothetical protein